ncbi:MAG: DUF58 domain-containing protein [Oscillospiraceae bacterium]|nr:DUF58 domain-containing protein [Oscillospiraceae bacterium]
MRLIYFLLLLFSAGFHVLYKGDLSFILLMFVLVMPFFMLIILCITAVSVRVNAYFEQTSVPRGMAAVLKINVKNNSVFPIARCYVEIAYKSNILFDSASKKKFSLSAAVGARANETFSINISPSHCGSVDVRITKIRLRDTLGLFSIPVKVTPENRIIALPIIFPIQAEIRNNASSTLESSTFSPFKPGDDPSEIFSLREYREGDNNNRIHWKLSSRSETFIVKELSLPVGSNILLIMDFCGCGNADSIDRILDSAFSVSNFLIEYGITHTIAYACSDYTVQRYEITNTDKFISAVSEIIFNLKNAAVDISFSSAEKTEEEFTVKSRFSRVITFSDRTDIVHTEELEATCGDAHLTIICTGSLDAAENDELYKTEIIYADAEKLSSNELLII